MDKTCEQMDEICAYLERLSRWVDHSELPVIPWAGYATGRLRNPPAPHVELIYMIEGGIPQGRVGQRLARYEQGTVTFNNIHFGAWSLALTPPVRAWCMFLDVGEATELADLARRPVFAAMAVRQPAALLLCCDKVTAASRLPGAQPPAYPHGPAAYDPVSSRLYGPAPRLRLKAAVLELLALLLEQAGAGAADPETEPAAITAALHFLRRRYQDPHLDLPQLARSARLSVDHFGRLFHKTTGVTPLRYLRRLRLEQSRRLLAQSSLQVAEIAHEVGFADPLHFSRIFRQETGASPRQYRQQHAAPRPRS